MAVQTISKPIDALLTNTLERVKPVLADNIFKGNPVTGVLYDKRERVAGGTFLDYPVLYAENSTVKWASGGYDTFNTTAQEGMTWAHYQWRTLFLITSISGDERRKNMGESQIMSLVKNKLSQTTMTAKQAINREICQISTAKDPNSLLGLDQIVDDDTAFASVLAGIPATNTWWRNQQRDPGTATKWATFLANLYQDCSEGTEKPDLMVTTKTAYADLEAKMAGQIRITTVPTFDELGFENLRYKNAAIVPDFFCQPGKFYMLNTNFLKLVVHPEADFARGEFVEVANQDAFLSKVIWMGQLVTSNRRYQGVNVTTAVPDGASSWA